MSELESFDSLGDGTRVVHAVSGAPGEPFGAQPVFASAFHLGGQDSYGRAGNPTWRSLESALGALEGGECVVFPSGMAAISTLLRTVLSTGDTLVLPSDGYFLTRKFVSEMDVNVVEVPTAGPYPSFEGAKLVLLETPSNPGLDVCDIAELAAQAHAAGALLAVDNTTATPLGQRPLELGADIVVASDTKALAGHSDVLFGHVTTAPAFADLAARVRDARTLNGAIPGPFETWLALRGLGTLDLRLARQAENAAAIYSLLKGRVANLRWPGASDDPSYLVAAQQMRRFNGVLSFELPDVAAVDEFLSRAKLVSAATSFGGLHSTADRRAQFGDPVPEGLVRFSAGCEDTRDLVADVSQALGLV